MEFDGTKTQNLNAITDCFLWAIDMNNKLTIFCLNKLKKNEKKLFFVFHGELWPQKSLGSNWLIDSYYQTLHYKKSHSSSI